MVIFVVADDVQKAASEVVLTSIAASDSQVSKNGHWFCLVLQLTMPYFVSVVPWACTYFLHSLLQCFHGMPGVILVCCKWLVSPDHSVIQGQAPVM